MSSSASAPTSKPSSGAELMSRMDAVDDRVLSVAGVVHGGYGALVAVVADALDEGLWRQAGIHSPAHWLAWKSGLSMRRARHVVLVAGRRAELPVAVAAMVAGELSLDQVRVIAAHVPAAYDVAATELARVLTVSQLERTLPGYAFDDDAPAPAPASGTGAADHDPGEGAGGDAAGRADDLTEGDGEQREGAGDRPAGRADGPAGRGDDHGTTDGSNRGGFGGFGGFGPGVEEKRRASWSFDDAGMGRLSACLPADESLVFDAAWRAARTDLLTRRRAELPDGVAVPWISGSDVLMHLARTYLDHGRDRRPDADRYLIHTHLDHHADGRPVMRAHLGPVLPDALRRYLACDADARPVWEVHGTALSVGRRERLVPDRTRRIIEQRDGGCIIPGCDRRWGLDVHHITHWEDGGSTDTTNLCCLCRTHHRQHHLGTLHITGDPDQPGGLVVTDRFGQVLEPAGRPDRLEPGRPLHDVATDRGLPTDPYRGGTGERLDSRWVHLHPAPPAPMPPPDPPPEPAGEPPPGRPAGDPAGDPPRRRPERSASSREGHPPTAGPDP